MAILVWIFIIKTLLSPLFTQATLQDLVSIIFPPTLEIQMGIKTTVELQVQVKPGYHVNANPCLDKFLYPTFLKIEPHKLLKIDLPVYPPGQVFTYLHSSDNFLIYENQFGIQFEVTPRKKKDNLEGVLIAQLRYQACDSISCLMPQTIPIRLPFKIVSPSQSP